VRIVPRGKPLAPCRRDDLERVTAAAFGQRRKMLRGSLKPLGLDPAEAGLDPTARAEELDVAAFCALAARLRAAAR
jgi:16S rRNA (adenine1518-N6/adenine1519-N6)-dimethyltransferase